MCDRHDGSHFEEQGPQTVPHVGNMAIISAVHPRVLLSDLQLTPLFAARLDVAYKHRIYNAVFFTTANFCFMNQIHKAYIWATHILYYILNVSYVKRKKISFFSTLQAFTCQPNQFMISSLSFLSLPISFALANISLNTQRILLACSLPSKLITEAKGLQYKSLSD